MYVDSNVIFFPVICFFLSSSSENLCHVTYSYYITRYDQSLCLYNVTLRSSVDYITRYDQSSCLYSVTLWSIIFVWTTSHIMIDHYAPNMKILVAENIHLITFSLTSAGLYCTMIFKYQTKKKWICALHEQLHWRYDLKKRSILINVQLLTRYLERSFSTADEQLQTDVAFFICVKNAQVSDNSITKIDATKLSACYHINK